MQVMTEGLRACSRLFLYYFPLLFLFYAEERSAHIFDFANPGIAGREHNQFRAQRFLIFSGLNVVERLSMDTCQRRACLLRESDTAHEVLVPRV